MGSVRATGREGQEIGDEAHTSYLSPGGSAAPSMYPTKWEPLPGLPSLVGPAPNVPVFQNAPLGPICLWF